MQLRPYQRDCNKATVEHFADFQRTLIVKPTGTGKTVTFCHLIDDMCRNGDRCLIVAHKDELIRQAYQKVFEITGEEPGVEKASEYADRDSSIYAHINKRRVVVTSVQTMNSGKGDKRRMHTFNPEEFGLVIIDEAHHGVADTYQRLIDHFCTNDRLRVAGYTATPDRADELALGRVFQSVAYDYELPDAIHDGWLVPIQQQFVECTGLDLSEVKTTAGDLNQGELAAIVEEEKHLHAMVMPTIEIAGDRQVIFFCTTVKQAERATEIFNRHHPGAAFIIHAKTPEEQRRDLVAKFKARDLQYFCNVGIATEGFDCSAEVVAVARPTKSRPLYTQMVGRGTRPAPEIVELLGRRTDAADRRLDIAGSIKPNMLVLDFVGNSGRHKLCHVGDLLGGKYDDDVLEAAKKSARAKRGACDMEQELLDAANMMGELGERRRKQIRIKAQWKAREVDPFDVFDMRPERIKGWHIGRPLTPKMLAALTKFGVDEKRLSVMTFQQGSQLMDTLIRRIQADQCSYKQAKLLAKMGLPIDVGFKEAGGMIDRVAKNHWKVPDDMLTSS